jgi:hypothetical protein
MWNRSVAAAVLIVMAGCTERTVTPPTDGPESAPPVSPSARQPAPPIELARIVAKGLKNAAFRAYLKAQLDASPSRGGEHKLQFETFLAANSGRALRQIAGENGASTDGVARAAKEAIALEVYFPVAEHAAAWTGDENVLVATALKDDDPPIAFDSRGRQLMLDPKTPPATPVLALVPVETDFSVRPVRQQCLEDCGGGGSGDVMPPPPPPPGLYMTKSHFGQDFEGWLKGSPEFEVHILGQLGQTDSLSDYQCAGEHAGGPYTFDQNGKDWTGRVLLFSKNQIDQYNAAHPNQNVRVFVVEDDDTACQIKTDPDRFQDLIYTVDSAYNRLTSGNDSSTVIRKYWGRAQAVYNVFQKLASWFKSNDELVGNAVKDDVVGVFYPGYNWFVKGQNNITNGWINLVMY